MDASDLQKYLESKGFTEYSTIKPYIDRNAFNFNDIIGCNENELDAGLSELGVDDEDQRMVFINAIKELPNSKMNEQRKAQNTNTNTSTNQRSLACIDARNKNEKKSQGQKNNKKQNDKKLFDEVCIPIVDTF